MKMINRFIEFLGKEKKESIKENESIINREKVTPSDYIYNRIKGISKPIIFDVGANVGETTNEYFRLYNQAIIYAFEPDKKSFGLLSKDERIYKVSNFALGDKNSVEKIYINKHPATHSLLVPHKEGKLNTDNYDDLDCVKVEETQVLTLDCFCQTNQINKINILKIDTQGYDHKVLLGAKNMISSQSIDFIYFEANFLPMYEKQGSFFESGLMLEKMNYKFLGLEGEKHHIDGRLRWSEAIFYKG